MRQPIREGIRLRPVKRGSLPGAEKFNETQRIAEAFANTTILTNTGRNRFSLSQRNAVFEIDTSGAGGGGQATTDPFFVSQSTTNNQNFDIVAGTVIMPLLFPNSTSSRTVNPAYCFMRYEFPGDTINIPNWLDGPGFHNLAGVWIELIQDYLMQETILYSLIYGFLDGTSTFEAGTAAPPIYSQLVNDGSTEFLHIPLAKIHASTVNIDGTIGTATITQYQSLTGHAIEHGLGSRALRHCGSYLLQRLYYPGDIVHGTVGGNFPGTNSFYWNNVDAGINLDYNSGNWTAL